MKQRDERGLRVGVKYLFKSDGTVDYRAMIPLEFLAFNRGKEDEISAKYNRQFKNIKPSDFSLAELEDNHLVLLLGGVRYLAWLRGAKAVLPHCNISSYGHTSITTNITWIGNYETDFLEETYGDTGLATFANTFDFAQNYLDQIANNRAYVRAVRNYLNVHIVANDEIGPKWTAPAQTPEPSRASGHKPVDIFVNKLDERGLTFEKFKAGFLKRYAGKVSLESDPKIWTDVKDIPSNDLYTLTGLLEPKE